MHLYLYIYIYIDIYIYIYIYIHIINAHSHTYCTQMEKETPPMAIGDRSGVRLQITPIPCALNTTSSTVYDDFEEEDFSWFQDDTSLDVQETEHKEHCEDDSADLDFDYAENCEVDFDEEHFEDDADDLDNQVDDCYCQSPPCCVPSDFTPCCLPPGVGLATREIQMDEVFRDNLLGINGAPPKTQTLRDWSPGRVAEHYHSYVHGKWIRVWRGQGHISTIGWLLLISWDTVTVCNIDKTDCVREGFPLLSSKEFVNMFFPNLNRTHQLHRLQFVFRACRACNRINVCS